MKCRYCRGTGDDRYKAGPCDVCNGSSTVPDPVSGDQPCTFCRESGDDRYWNAPCRVCGGLGYQKNNKTKSIRGENLDYINNKRIEALDKLASPDFDLAKLCQLCRELNIAYQTSSFYATAMIIRSIIDHVPPIFGFTSFKDFANQHGTKSFKDSMLHLEDGCRRLSDGYLHEHIRKKESLPTPEQVEYRSQVDKLLSEVIDLLS